MKTTSLFNTRRFWPLFVAQFMGAFNDNLYKNAMVILITYKIAAEQGVNAQILVTVAAALFILPFFLFSATAGQIADTYDRAALTRKIKLAEIVLVVFGSLALMSGNVLFMMAILFGLGAQSAFFGPIKYALLPQYLEEKELIGGNAYIEAGTFLAILTGTILGGVLVLQPVGIHMVSAGLLLCAVIGYYASVKMPTAPGPMPGMQIRWNVWKETLSILSYSRAHKDIFRCILGISWFWLVGAAFLAQFPTYAKDVIGGDETVVTLFLTVFSIGIGIGSVLCNRLLGGHVQSTYTPLAAFGMSIFMLDLYFASAQVMHAQEGTLLGVWEFISHATSLRILFDLMMIAICGGIYIVPLYAIMQSRSDKEHTARVIASNNVMNALFMVTSALLIVVLLKWNFTIPEVFLTIGILNAGVAVFIATLLPAALVRSLARTILAAIYRVEVKGLENFAKAGDRVLIIANHTSFLDAALIAAYLPEKITFAVNTYIAQNRWVKPFLSLVDAYPLDPTNPLATKALIEAIRKNRKCMIFPEGRITVTGSLMKVYEGPGMIADKAGAMILPIRIDGAQYTPFSRLRGKVHIRWFPKITLTVLEPRRFDVPDEIKGRARRQLAGTKLYDLMTRMLFDSSPTREPLFASLISTQAIHGRGHVIVEDIERKPLTLHMFITRAFTLGRLIERSFAQEKTLGVMLPNAVSTALTFFGLHAFGKIPAMLNFTAGGSQIVIACRTAGITTVLTAKRFITAAKLESVIADLEAGGISVVFLETLREQMVWYDKLFGLFAGLFPEWFYAHTGKQSDGEDTAVILFTSGSEGVPKAVVLSHQNIQSNRFQLASSIDFGPQDKVFNCLPMFHSFGLTGATLLPLLSGIRVFFYPTPLHYRIVPELVYDTNATIMFGTDTFLSGYAKFAHPYDFHSIRYVFAGAEKLKPATRAMWEEKFGVRIFEGYGATETAPVISTNTPMHNRLGTVGRLVPALEHRLEPVAGIEHGGRLWVRGPNVMLGYMKADAPGKLQPPEDGWYDTGDIVTLDGDGFITISGRLKRFAKIGGEMVSLTLVENAAHALWPNEMHAAVTVPDAKKGEQIILLTQRLDADRADLLHYYKEHAITELALPKRVISVGALPLLGTGKLDYVSAREMALRQEHV